jgi:hypothetical protein
MNIFVSYVRRGWYYNRLIHGGRSPGRQYPYSLRPTPHLYHRAISNPSGLYSSAATPNKPAPTAPSIASFRSTAGAAEPPLLVAAAALELALLAALLAASEAELATEDALSEAEEAASLADEAAEPVALLVEEPDEAVLLEPDAVDAQVADEG